MVDQFTWVIFSGFMDVRALAWALKDPDDFKRP
jgi:hypothetical protein